jgi:GTP-binding protein
MEQFRIPEAEFVLSCPRVELAPRTKLPEIAFAGRSNVGKSSLINSLLNRRKLALTARTPGKTRLLNYFRIGGDLCHFVDLPGYGYAKVSKSLQEEWGEFIEGYLRESELLRLVVLILDSRRGAAELDMQMIEGLSILQRPWLAVLTKCDKLTRTELDRARAKQRGLLVSLGAQDVVPYSATSHAGREQLWQRLIAAL